jgi:hypothetical protein
MIDTQDQVILTNNINITRFSPPGNRFLNRNCIPVLSLSGNPNGCLECARTILNVLASKRHQNPARTGYADSAITKESNFLCNSIFVNIFTKYISYLFDVLIYNVLSITN